MTTVTLAAVRFAKRTVALMMVLPIGAARIFPGPLSQNRPRRFAMLNVTTCNAALAVLIVLAALGPAIVDVARLAKCAIVPCRHKEPV
jgi:hypothetical protein